MRPEAWAPDFQPAFVPIGQDLVEFDLLARRQVAEIDLQLCPSSTFILTTVFNDCVHCRSCPSLGYYRKWAKDLVYLAGASAARAW